VFSRMGQVQVKDGGRTKALSASKFDAQIQGLEEDLRALRSARAQSALSGDGRRHRSESDETALGAAAD
jgi:hypothetical protein